MLLSVLQVFRNLKLLPQPSLITLSATQSAIALQSQRTGHSTVPAEPCSRPKLSLDMQLSAIYRMEKKIVELFNTALSNPSETQILACAISSTLQSAGPKPIKTFLIAFKRTIKNSHVAPSNKLRALHVFCVCMKSARAEFVQAAERKLINRLSILAMHKKDSQELARGATLFGNWGQMIEEAEASVEFLSLLLSSMRDWADRYMQLRAGELSKFYRAYQRLLTEGVFFPSSFDLSTQQERFNRMLEVLSSPESKPDDIAEVRRKLPDIRLQLTQALERESNPAQKADINALLRMVDRAFERRQHDFEASIHEKSCNIPYFQPITEPQPLELPSEIREMQQFQEEPEENSPLDRSSIAELSEELKMVDLRIECETLRDQRRQLESENSDLRQVISSLRNELEFVKQTKRNNIPNSPYLIANRASFQLLSGLEKGTLYSDKYCEVLIHLNLDVNPKACAGRFMLVVKSGVREVQETAKLQSLQTAELICKPVKELSTADIVAKGWGGAQYKFRYSELVPSCPVFTLSFVSEGLQYLYHFQLPILMLRFAEPLGQDSSLFTALWEELKESMSEASLPDFDPLIQNVPQLAERLRLGNSLAVYYAGVIAQGTVGAAGTLLGEKVLLKATVLPDRTLAIQAVARNQRMRNCVLQSILQVLETDTAS